MTAPLTYRALYINEQRPITDFMQTVQLNYELDEMLIRLADIHQRDGSGFTALYWAISHNNIYNVKLLLAYGATLDVSPALNAAFCAIACDRIDMLAFFINKGIDADIKSRGKTLLEFAQGLRRSEIVAYLKDINESNTIRSVMR